MLVNPELGRKGQGSSRQPSRSSLLESSEPRREDLFSLKQISMDVSYGKTPATASGFHMYLQTHKHTKHPTTPTPHPATNTSQNWSCSSSGIQRRYVKNIFFSIATDFLIFGSLLLVGHDKIVTFFQLRKSYRIKFIHVQITICC